MASNNKGPTLHPTLRSTYIEHWPQREVSKSVTKWGIRNPWYVPKIVTASKACYILSEHNQKWEDGAKAMGNQMKEYSMMESVGMYYDNDLLELCGSASNRWTK